MTHLVKFDVEVFKVNNKPFPFLLEQEVGHLLAERVTKETIEKQTNHTIKNRLLY